MSGGKYFRKAAFKWRGLGVEASRRPKLSCFYFFGLGVTGKV
jgi:hypothetical protein